MKITKRPTADEINEAHALAKSCAHDAVQHAIRCGHMLIWIKQSLDHGAFESWIEDNGSMGFSTARKYMKAARQNATGVAFSTLSALFPSQNKKTARQKPVDKSKKSTPISEPSNVIDLPAKEPEKQPEKPLPDIEEYVPDEAAEEAAHERAREEMDKALDTVMASDDRFAAFKVEIDRLTALVAVLEQSRDYYMGQASAAVKLVKARDRELARLRKAAA